jgi:hypothetical protein
LAFALFPRDSGLADPCPFMFLSHGLKSNFNWLCYDKLMGYIRRTYS